MNQKEIENKFGELTQLLIELNCRVANQEAVMRLERENKKLTELLKVAKCPSCDGSGAVQVQVSERYTVTRDMAIDAGDPSMEGATFSEDEWELQQCQWCDERNTAIKNLT
jgi:hypothetical protein